ncbi:xanthine dehydrogenase family protein molybdopterin-binding subunit [Bradyrhizobium sp. NP1]|uniref:xanthine dehydrogenase family protein molybdopterin-binding subunit n=1 Tax=Bradyrhizobium sp. NP1 TaxID=3049772 RepID=UPI0025A66FAA|nr:xanthine dehydrogenase family protein molybdopterin-binding subunit [Bradyrhizobium sp. NP1]WJR75888.1 xanthine dehydrogenase family protein molybdopterin-binding subunit [Bradyrhizobium sp. NP1]
MQTKIEPLSPADTASAGALAKFGIGQPVRRIEDLRFVRGAGRYVDDDSESGALHAAFLRSPHAHADIRRINVTAAKSSPGVVAVYTGEDWRNAGLSGLPLRPSITQADGSAIASPPRPGLATGRVRHVGDCVVMVVAETARSAADALELVDVEYAPLPCNVDLRGAMDAGTPELWPDQAPRNLAFTWRVGDAAKTARALADAAHVVTLELINNRLVPNSMEPRGVVARYDDRTERLTLSGSIQNPFGFQGLICDLFGWPKDKLRCRADDVGGGFGCKNQLQQEHAMTLFACDRLKRTVKWINDRGGSFVSDAHARDLVTTVRLGLDAAGHFVGLAVDTIANLGAYMSTNGALIPTLPTAAVLGGAYDLPAISMEVRAFFTNTVPVDAYRGAGRPEAIYLLERTIDVAARELNVSAVKLRRKNLIKRAQLPYRNALGRDIDVGSFDTVLSKALELADEKDFPKRAKVARKQNKLRGLGVAYYLEATLGPPADAARIVFSPDGRATLSVGTQSNGQGHETTFIQIAAAQFGIAPDQFSFRQADTDATREGGGHGGSRSLQLGGTAVLLAARQIIDRGKRIASQLLEVGEADVEYVPGRYAVAGTDHSVSFADVVRAAFDPKLVPPQGGPGLDEIARYEREAFNYPNGCHVCEVEIDIDTGITRVVNYSVVDDFGRIINPLIVRGQVLGGVVQGIGQALLEDTRYDQAGQLLTASFMDYSMPRADDISIIKVELYEGAPTQTNPLGAKGCGEAGATGSPPAVVNAVVDALREYGVVHLDMPLTREKIWSVLHKRG